MSFFLFRSKKGKIAMEDEASVGGVPKSQPGLEQWPKRQCEAEANGDLLPAGISLINPSLEPDKARNFADIGLPQSFIVRFLGSHPSTGIWGIKHTRKPVDILVELAKSTEADDLSVLQLDIADSGVSLRQISPSRPNDTSKEIDLGHKPIERISYGVQDVVFPRVFAMISIKDKSLIDEQPFDCFVFLCQSRIQSRKLAYCLAKAFKNYGDTIKAANYTQTLNPDLGESSERSTDEASSKRSSKSTAESDV